MNATKSLLVSAVAAVALTCALVSEATAARGGGSGGGASYGHGSGHGYGYGNGRGYGYGYGRYGYGYGYRGYGYWRPWYGFYLAAPFVFGAAYASWDPYWGYWGPRYYPYSYYGGGASYPDPRYYDGPQMSMGGEGTTEDSPNAEGAPTQAPLYLNYCAAAKAYFPKVATCPGGWQFRPPQ